MKYLILFFISFVFPFCHSVPVMDADRLESLAERMEEGEEIQRTEIIKTLKQSADIIRTSERDRINAEDERDDAKAEARTWSNIKYSSLMILILISVIYGTRSVLKIRGIV